MNIVGKIKAIYARMGPRTSERLDSIERRVDAIEHHISAMTRDRIEPVEQELMLLRESLNDLTTRDNFPDEYYDDLEKLFRGSETDLLKRLEAYIPILSDNTRLQKELPAIDLGCGRGEWLNLLAQNGFNTIGVDLNDSFVSQCQSHGHDAHKTDILEFLVNSETESASLISAIHVIEHIKNRTLVDVIRQSQRVLSTGGMLILESPNPENIVVSADSFYIDPTHSTPRHPLTMHFLVTRCGFSDVNIVRLKEGRLEKVTPFDEILTEQGPAQCKKAATYLNDKFFSAPDYAIVAIK